MSLQKKFRERPRADEIAALLLVPQVLAVITALVLAPARGRSIFGVAP